MSGYTLKESRGVVTLHIEGADESPEAVAAFTAAAERQAKVAPNGSAILDSRQSKVRANELLTAWFHAIALPMTGNSTLDERRANRATHACEVMALLRAATLLQAEMAMIAGTLGVPPTILEAWTDRAFEDCQAAAKNERHITAYADWTKVHCEEPSTPEKE